MLSLHVGVRRENAPAGILGYSGRLEAPETLADEIKVRPRGYVHPRRRRPLAQHRADGHGGGAAPGKTVLRSTPIVGRRWLTVSTRTALISVLDF